MNKIITVLYLSWVFLTVLPLKAQQPLSYVDTRIGNVAIMLQPTRPTVQLPNQFIRSYPGRKDHIDDQITCFPLSLISHRMGMLFSIMPFTGTNTADVKPISACDNDLETLLPYYYSVWLDDYNTTVDFTPGAKCGYFKIKYPNDIQKNIFLKNENEGNWNVINNTELAGEENFNGMKAWVYAQVNQPFEYTKAQKQQAIISFKNNSLNIVEFKYAISFISAQQAKQNLSFELANSEFDQIKNQAKLAWDKVLNTIEVKGGTEARKRTFYTALYRCYERMVNVSENGQYYSNYDKKIHTDSRNFYIDDWIWDTYLALHPLRFILNPDLESDFIASYIRMYEQSGSLPQFPVLWGDNPCMNGFHSTIMILDAYRKGIANFDVNKAYQGMKKNALHTTMIPWRKGPLSTLDTFYFKNGYYPALQINEAETEPRVHHFEKRQAVAITLGHSFDDWALAQMAKHLGFTDDYNTFSKRSENYKNLYWPEKGMFMPKDKNGNWINIDPKFDGGMGCRDYYDENNGWTYLWQVQHNIPALMQLMGGTVKFENCLDQLFREDLGRSKWDTWAALPDFTGMVGQYSMGNEPSFHIPYLYNFTNAPWKTQKRIRMLLNTWFPDNIHGIPGDEDGGGMSAFIVFSCMGFYPVIPGIPVYTIGSPVFEQTTIHLPNGKNFIISAPGCSETNKYIQQAFLNDKPLNGSWFTHSDIVNGGELKLVMGELPNKSWGAEFDYQTLMLNSIINITK